MLVQQAHGQAEAISDEDDDMPPEDSSQMDLRKMVLKAVMKDVNEIIFQKPYIL